ncbi:MAG: histidine--tRNA ligase [Thermodesulfobacteriota bacterium]|nr:histidine--tRNA ligase [Thermodesulfobacteriota bacterium]
MAKIQKIKGVADLFEPESSKFTRMEQTAREVFARYGYRELRIPVLEATELFARSIGEETDVVQKEMYTFADRKGRSLTLRPEATAGVIRAYIESNLHASEQVSRLFSFGPMFRYERPQKGRMRQFHQINAEMIGPREPQADAEVLLMLWTYLRALGLKKLCFEVNCLGCEKCRPTYREALTGFFKTLENDDLCPDCRRRMETNPMRVLDCKIRECQKAIQDAPVIADHLCGECEAHFKAVLGLLEVSGVEYELNPRLVRGLDYYVGVTFEISSSDIGAQTAVAGGGRYDGLVKLLGGPDVPGVGFAVGMERLAMLLDAGEPEGLDFYVAVLVPRGLDTALSLAQGLRDKGFRGQAGFEAKSLKSQLRAANKARARVCLILGEDELSRGQVVVKRMESGDQESVALSDVSNRLK